MVNVLDKLTGSSSTLVLLADRDENVELSSRNLATAKTLRANYLNIRDILGHQKIVMPIPALEVIQAFLGDSDGAPLVAEFSAAITTAEEEE